MILRIKDDESLANANFDNLSSSPFFDPALIGELKSIQFLIKKEKAIEKVKEQQKESPDFESFILSCLKEKLVLSTDQIQDLIEKEFDHTILVDGFISRFLRKASKTNQPYEIEMVSKGSEFEYTYKESTQTVSMLSDILVALRDGTVPGEGIEKISVGNDSILSEADSQIDRVKIGKSGFKFLIGDYGSGKTFLSKLIQQKAFDKGFVVSYNTISQETPFQKFEDLFKRIMDHMQTRDYRVASALSLMIEEWLLQLEDNLIEAEHLHRNQDTQKLCTLMESKINDQLSQIGEQESSFTRAIRGYYKARLSRDNELAQSSLAWLKGEHVRADLKKEIEIKGDMNKSSAITFFQTWIRMIKTIGYSGLVIIFDEMETIQKLRTIDLRLEAYKNLRLFIDESDKNSFPNCYFLFTGTNSFLEGERGIKSYEPLFQRIFIEKDKTFPNHREPILYIDRMSKDSLFQISKKISSIHGEVYHWNPDNKITEPFLSKMIHDLTIDPETKGRIYPRGFIRTFIDILDKAQQFKDYKPEDMFQFTEEILQKANEVEDDSFIVKN